MFSKKVKNSLYHHALRVSRAITYSFMDLKITSIGLWQI